MPLFWTDLHSLRSLQLKPFVGYDTHFLVSRRAEDEGLRPRRLGLLDFEGEAGSANFQMLRTHADHHLGTRLQTGYACQGQ